MLRLQILRAELAPGEVVIVTGLAQEHGVSKTPVREALQLLSVKGLATVLPRKGYMVTSLSYQDIREVNAAMIREYFTGDLPGPS